MTSTRHLASAYGQQCLQNLSRLYPNCIEAYGVLIPGQRSHFETGSSRKGRGNCHYPIFGAAGAATATNSSAAIGRVNTML
jgi:hypothetical protein